jgi:hypothetical protein
MRFRDSTKGVVVSGVSARAARFAAACQCPKNDAPKRGKSTFGALLPRQSRPLGFTPTGPFGTAVCHASSSSRHNRFAPVAGAGEWRRRGRRYRPASRESRRPSGQRSPLRRPNRSRRARGQSDSPADRCCFCDRAEETAANRRFTQTFLASAFPDEDDDVLIPPCNVVIAQFERLGRHHQQAGMGEETNRLSPLRCTA